LIRDRQKNVSTHRIRADAGNPIGAADAAAIAAEARADSRPLVKLHQVSVTGALTIPADQLITAYQPYLGKKVSQADLVAIAGAVSDLYRAGRLSPEPRHRATADIRDGHLRLQVIEGSITRSR